MMEISNERVLYNILSFLMIFIIFVPLIIEKSENMALGKKFITDFPPISTEKWMEQINADLKGADFERKLVWRTQEGFDVRPFYRQEDLEKVSHLGALPGEFPFVRGNNKENNDWFIRQDVKVTTPKEANEKAHDILNRGADSIGFILDCKEEYTKEDFKVLLGGFYLEIIEINFVNAVGKAIANFVELMDEYEVDKSKIRGSVSFAPLENLTTRGVLHKGQHDTFDRAKMLLKVSEEFPNFRVLNVKGKTFHNSGATIVQELAFSLAAGVEILEKVMAQGVSIEEIAPKMQFHFGVGTTYFMEIAKFRAARLLWAKIIEAYKPQSLEYCKMCIHAETSDWNKTIYDPYVNMLRTQTESMSAVLGGVNSLVVNPFDEVFEDTTEFSERIARNQQLLLKEEVNLDKVTDPAGGSYYIEYLTDAIAEQAWKLFLEVQDKGGYISAFEGGFIQKTIEVTAQKRDIAIATRRENLLGTNQFPNFGEVVTTVFDDCILTPCDKKETNVSILKPYRGAQAFEQMRLKTDAFSVKNGRPQVQMLTIGNLNMRKARAQFASNFFACAGFEVHDHNGFNTVEEGVKYSLDKKSDIVVICSSDEEYEKYAVDAYKLLNDKALFVVAGSPSCMEELQKQGVANFIHVKSNVLETLKEYQQKLGI